MDNEWRDDTWSPDDSTMMALEDMADDDAGDAEIERYMQAIGMTYVSDEGWQR